MHLHTCACVSLRQVRDTVEPVDMRAHGRALDERSKVQVRFSLLPYFVFVPPCLFLWSSLPVRMALDVRTCALFRS